MQHTFPSQLAIIPVVSGCHEFKLATDQFIVMGTGCRVRTRFKVLANFAGVGQEYKLAGDDGRRVTKSPDLRLPGNVFRFAPLLRRVGMRCDTGHPGSTPLTPLMFGDIRFGEGGPLTRFRLTW